jgi:hypothetical protein
MSSFLKSPLRIRKQEGGHQLARPLDSEVARLDNLIELVVFTRRGSFTADPDFGFEYWNHEFSNVHVREFNNGQEGGAMEASKKLCEDSIRDSLAAYEPSFRQVDVVMELTAVSSKDQSRKKSLSKYEVRVRVDGLLGDGLGTARMYSKTVRFLMEPTAQIMK